MPGDIERAVPTRLYRFVFTAVTAIIIVAGVDRIVCFVVYEPGESVPVLGCPGLLLAGAVPVVLGQWRTGDARVRVIRL